MPGLTLVDMQLPDIDGLEVLQRLRADPATAGLRVVALSANAIPADIQRALDAGFDDYWTKPLDFGVFNAAIERVFGPAGPVG
jgi:CheY-like chemotaxis protein